jgi:hypothetical protein
VLCKGCWFKATGGLVELPRCQGWTGGQAANKIVNISLIGLQIEATRLNRIAKIEEKRITPVTLTPLFEDKKDD